MMSESRTIMEDNLRQNRVRLAADIAELHEKLNQVEKYAQASLDEMVSKRRHDLEQVNLRMSRDMQKAFELVTRIQHRKDREDCVAEMSELAQIQHGLESVIRMEDADVIQTLNVCYGKNVLKTLKHLSCPELVMIKSKVKAQDIKLIVRSVNDKLTLSLVLLDSARNLSPLLYSDLKIAIGSHFNQTDLKTLVKEGQVLDCGLRNCHTLDIVLAIDYKSRGTVQVMMYGEHVENSPWTAVPDLDLQGFTKLEAINGFKRNRNYQDMDGSDIKACAVQDYTEFIDPDADTILDHSKRGKVSFHHQTSVM